MSTKPPLKFLFIAIILGILNSAFSLVLPLLLKHQIDVLSSGISYKLILLIGVVIIGQIVTMSFSMYLLSIVGNKVVLNIREKLWKKLLNLELDFYLKNQSGEVVSRVINDTTAAMTLLSTDIARFITSLISIIGSIIIMFYLDIQLTIAILIFLPIIILIIIPISNKIKSVSFLQYEYMSLLVGFLSRIISEIRLVKAFNTQKLELDNGIKYFNDVYDNSIKKAKIESFLFPLLNALTLLMITIVLGFGFYRIQQGFISTGDLLAFIFYLFQITSPIGTIGSFISNFQSFRGSTERIFEILDSKEENESMVNLVSFNNKSRSVGLEIANLSFKYNDVPILEDVSFTVPPGTTTALVGKSGSGKSTLFYLLERFYQPEKGEIMLNGESFEKISLSEWRSMFSYVSQDSQIFAGTIRENLVYGINREISSAELKDVCELANCHDFITTFSKGFETQLGERGVNLSGGQKQRIAIARALLKNTPIMLLDEATANLDTISEEVIKQTLEKRKLNQTTLIIAHRMSTIINADQIIVLNKGKVVGVGTHQEMLKTNNWYRELVQNQIGDTLLN